MNPIFFGFQHHHALPILKALIEHFALSHITTVDEGPLVLNSEDCVVDHHDIRLIHTGTYPKADNEQEPLSEQLILRMAECEMTAMRMMDRLDPFTDREYSVRKRLYLRHLRYWNDYIDTHSITHFISMNMPHDIEDFILYCLCLEKGVQTSFFYQSPLPNATFLLEKCDDFTPELKSEYEKIAEDDASAIKLETEFQAHWEFQIGKSGNPEPLYMPLVRNEIKRIASFNYTVKRSWTKLQQLAADFRRSGDLSQVSYHFQDLISRYFKRRRTLARDRALVKVYKAKACAPDLNQDFIYVALHYQPECTTCPMGGAFVDQYLMIDILAKSIPRTMRLYVKEHPVQRSNGRSVQFYEDILKLPNVYLVSQETSTFDLIRNAFAVATVTGTVGWESLFFMKPVLMFGEFFYKHAIGVFQIKDIKAAKQAIAHIHAGVKPTQQSMRCLLLAIQRICVRGYSIAEYEPYAGVPKEKNATVLAGALINRLSTDASSR